MNYWLVARQFEAHVLGKVQEYELFPLLYQSCKSAVQLKTSHFSNQSPSVAFCIAWDLLYDEYGHSHEIARCCEERLRGAAKVPEDDREKLKSLANLLEKCCVSLKDIGQTSNLDSMHVMMSEINKLPLDLKRAWIEFSVKIERQSENRARFNDLSTFLFERSGLANSIFGRETFPGRVKIRKEIAYTVITFAVQSNEVLKCVKCYCCEGPHRLTECNEFRKKTYEDKCMVVKSKNLCFKCLNGKHFARDCKSKQNCTVPGCTETLHHKLLHRSQTPTQGKSTRLMTYVILYKS